MQDLCQPQHGRVDGYLLYSTDLLIFVCVSLTGLCVQHCLLARHA